MFATLEECIAAWEQAGQHGDLQQRIERNARWIPYYAYLADQCGNNDAAIDPHAKEVVAHLFDRGLLALESGVLISAPERETLRLRLRRGANPSRRWRWTRRLSKSVKRRQSS
jgi:hypothetical protein